MRGCPGVPGIRVPEMRMPEFYSLALKGAFFAEVLDS